MPFSAAVKTRMFFRCRRFCCICHKKCDTNIEAAHIIAESEGGPSDEDNGIPLCFDCHLRIGSYNDSHPRGNKFRPDELRKLRDEVYKRAESGTLDALSPTNPQRLIERRLDMQLKLQTSSDRCENPTIAQILVAIDKLDHRKWADAFLVLEDSVWDNAFVQACQEPSGLYYIEYRDGTTQLQYRTTHEVGIETVKLAFLTYMRMGDELMRYGIKWDEVTSTLRDA